MKRPKCPECSDELDVFPNDAKFGYCYTCHTRRLVGTVTQGEIKVKMKKIWLSGVPTTWSDKKLARWKKLKQRLEELGIDTNKKHFFLDEDVTLTQQVRNQYEKIKVHKM